MSVPNFNPGIDLPNFTDVSLGNITNATLCDFTLDTSGNLFSLILAIVLIVIGLIFLFVGSRYFKKTLFGFSFLFGAGLGFYVVTLVSDCNTQAGLIVAVIMGLMLGALTVKLWKLAIFTMGVGVGFIAWTTFKALGSSLMTTDYIIYGSLAVVCIICGIIALKMEKYWLLVGTPIVGSFMVTQGIDHFIDQDVNVFRILDTVTGEGAGCSLTECYIIYAMLIGLALIGAFVQVRYTSEMAEERRELEEEEREEEESRSRKKKKKKSKKKKGKKSKKKRKKGKRRRRRRRRSSSSDSSD